MQDLGGLGDREGARIPYTWTPTSLFPRLVPWLALLVLLALKRNRAAGAWWIWAGVGGGLALESLLRAFVRFVPSQPLDALAQALQAMNFGLAAVWLVSGYLAWKHRFLTFLAILGIALVFGLGICVISQAWADGAAEAFVTGTVAGMSVLILSLALSLTGLLSRRQYHPARLLVWSAVMTIGATVLVLAPFFLFAVLADPGRAPIAELLEALGLLAGMNLAMLLVYLVLSFATGFYRRRLIGLLRLGAPEQPPLIPAPPALELTGAK